MCKDFLLISFSGGKTSAYMTMQLLDKYSDKYDFLVVFANTGQENEETLEFVHKCDTEYGFNTIWVEAVTNPKHGKGVKAKVVNYLTASRNGEPFEASISKHGIPNINVPHCTRELKTRTINAYMRENGYKRFYRAIGIRIDEVDRVNPNYEKERIIYPLVSWFPTTKKEINDFWDRQLFKLEIPEERGNCKVCFKKSLAKLIRIARETPNDFDWASSMEDKFSMYVPNSRKHNENIKLPIHFFRYNLSAKDILRLSLLTDEEIKAELKLKTLEVSNGCSESCEAY